MYDNVIYTIGHSTHSQESFLGLLNNYAVNCVVDVRSTPFSAHVPQFNKETLRQYLDDHGIVYLHFPKAFGARQRDPELLDDSGRVDFEKVRQSKSFREGIDKLRQCLDRGVKVALMCSEGNPLDCHRFSMIAYQLAKDGFLVRHILKTGDVVDNKDLERLLLARYAQKLTERSLFDHRSMNEAQVELAYKLRNKEIGYLAGKAI
jgi:uncharacterized protein (DUF488 family)